MDQALKLILECLAIFGTSLLHEDLAIISAAVVILQYGLSPVAGLFALYFGVITGDFLIYGSGFAGRRIPFLRRLLIKKSVENARVWLKENLVLSVASCRLLPGVLFPTYLACGWLGMPFKTFALTTMATAAIYVPIALAIAVGLKETLLKSLGAWGYLVLVAIVAVLWLVAGRKPKWVTMGKLVSAGEHVLHPHGHHPQEPLTHRGMPALGKLSRWVAAAEKINPTLFYIPFGFYWIYLGLKYRGFMLPTIANPHIEAGGMWGESKADCMRQVSSEQARWIARFIDVVRLPGARAAEDARDAVAAMNSAGLAFPLVVKPDIGWQGFGVRVVRSEESLRDYFAVYPHGARLLLQELVDDDGEAGVLYCRMPGEEKGRILSVTLRYFPFVVGDGETTLRDLILEDPRNRFKGVYHFGSDSLHSGLSSQDMDRVPASGETVRLAFIGSIRVGGLYKDATGSITEAMNERFDAIARSMPDFHFGRFDVRFGSMESLQQGEDFKIIEINGVGSEAIQVWDPDKSLRESYRVLLETHELTFKIGAANRKRGFKAISIQEFLRYSYRQQSLIAKYPPSE